MRGPALASARRSSPASRSTSDQRRVSISLLRQPVSIRRRIAATAFGDAPPSTAARSSTWPSRVNSASVRKRSRDRSGYFSTDWQGLRPSGARPQPSPRRYMCDSSLTALFRRDGLRAQPLLEFDDVALFDRCKRHATERRQDVAADQNLHQRLRAGLQAHGRVLLQVARREVGHGGAAVRHRGERQGQRLLAGPDARDDERRPPAGLLGVEHVVAADRHAPGQLLSRPFPCLGDVDLAARRIDPDAEAGQVPGPRTPCRARPRAPPRCGWKGSRAGPPSASLLRPPRRGPA